MKLKFILSLCLTTASLSMAAQQKVSGTVIDRNGNPLPGVRIELKDSQTQAVSDIDGAFTMTLLPGQNNRFTATYVGMRPVRGSLKDDMVIKMKGSPYGDGLWDTDKPGFQAGQWSVGLSLGAWRSIKYEETTVTVAPDFNYHINYRWAVGAQLGFQYMRDRDSWDSEWELYERFKYLISPYVRFTAFRFGIVGLILDGAVDIDMGSHKYSDWYDGERDSEFHFGYAIGIKPGLTLDVSKNFTLIAHFGFLGYRSYFTKSEIYYYDYDDNGFGLDFSNSFSFGCYYNF